MLGAGKGQVGWCDRVLARLRNFFSAFFDESAFRWFYIVSVIGSISGQCEFANAAPRLAGATSVEAYTSYSPIRQSGEQVQSGGIKKMTVV